MAVKTDKKRIMITVSKEMANKIEFYSEKMGVTQSAICAQFVGQGIMGYDKAYEIMDKMGEDIVRNSLDNVKNGNEE